MADRGRIWLAAAVVCFVALASPPARAAWVPDVWVTLTTKAALLTTAEIDATRIDVDTVDGRVTLHGTVATRAEREAAEAAAARVAGARSVRNLLQIVSAARGDKVARSDDAIRRDVEPVLARVARSDGTAIQLQSMNNGVAFLSGEAATPADLVRALGAVRRVRGVRAVASEVRLTKGAKPDDVLAGREFRPESRGALDVTTDLTITVSVKLSLLADPRIPALDVNVDTTDRVVTLFGIVPTADAKSAAAERARGVAAVKRVENRLQVVAARNLEAVHRRDDELHAAVMRKLSERPPLERLVLKVEAQNGIVRLTGTVPSESHRLLAVTTARRVRGVRAVEEGLEVRRIVAEPEKETKK